MTEQRRKTRKRRRLLAVLLIVLLAIVLGGVLPVYSVRRAIARADQVELRVFIGSNQAAGMDVFTLTDPDDIRALAHSIRPAGIPSPFDVLIANSYRIRIRKGERTTDYIIRAWSLKLGALYFPLSGALSETCNRLAAKHGTEVPSSRDVIEHLRATSSQESS